MKTFLFPIFLSVAASAQSPAKVVLWNSLSAYDLAKHSPGRELAALDGQLVRVPGYMIPLEVKQDKTTEFLLMPSLANCIHVPPPPANQTVHVFFPPGKSASVTWQPIWVEGRLKIAKTDTDAAFELGALKVSAFSASDARSVLPQDNSARKFDCQGRDKDEPVCASRAQNPSP